MVLGWVLSSITYRGGDILDEVQDGVLVCAEQGEVSLVFRLRWGLRLGLGEERSVASRRTSRGAWRGGCHCWM